MEVILIVSLLANVILLPYSIKCARRLLTVASNLNSLQEKFTIFRAHVDVLHESEMFYGDKSLEALMNHSKDILEDIDQYEDIYTLIDEEENEETGEVTELGEDDEEAAATN